MKQMRLFNLFVLVIYYRNTFAFLSDPKCGIWNGDPSERPPNFGWVAKVAIKSSKNPCYANVISKQWLLGAAACLPPKTPMDDYTVSTFDNAIYEISKIVISPKYNPTLGAGYDLALIKTKRAMNIKSTVQPICLADYDSNNQQKIDTNSDCRNIQNYPFLTGNDDNCLDTFKNLYHPQYMLCGKGKAAANCMSKGVEATNGAPIICLDQMDGRWYLAGLASWGRDCRVKTNRPANEAYTKLYGDSKYIDWINSTMHSH